MVWLNLQSAFKIRHLGALAAFATYCVSISIGYSLSSQAAEPNFTPNDGKVATDTTVDLNRDLGTASRSMPSTDAATCSVNSTPAIANECNEHQVVGKLLSETIDEHYQPRSQVTARSVALDLLSGHMPESVRGEYLTRLSQANPQFYTHFVDEVQGVSAMLKLTYAGEIKANDSNTLDSTITGISEMAFRNLSSKCELLAKHMDANLEFASKEGLVSATGANIINLRSKARALRDAISAAQKSHSSETLLAFIKNYDELRVSAKKVTSKMNRAHDSSVNLDENLLFSLQAGVEYGKAYLGKVPVFGPLSVGLIDAATVCGEDYFLKGKVDEESARRAALNFFFGTLASQFGHKVVSKIQEMPAVNSAILKFLAKKMRFDQLKGFLLGTIRHFASTAANGALSAAYSREMQCRQDPSIEGCESYLKTITTPLQGADEAVAESMKPKNLILTGAGVAGGRGPNIELERSGSRPELAVQSRRNPDERRAATQSPDDLNRRSESAERARPVPAVTEDELPDLPAPPKAAQKDDKAAKKFEKEKLRYREVDPKKVEELNTMLDGLSEKKRTQPDGTVRPLTPAESTRALSGVESMLNEKGIPAEINSKENWVKILPNQELLSRIKARNKPEGFLQSLLSRLNSKPKEVEKELNLPWQVVVATVLAARGEQFIWKVDGGLESGLLGSHNGFSKTVHLHDKLILEEHVPSTLVHELIHSKKDKRFEMTEDGFKQSSKNAQKEAKKRGNSYSEPRYDLVTRISPKAGGLSALDLKFRLPNDLSMRLNEQNHDFVADYKSGFRSDELDARLPQVGVQQRNVDMGFEPENKALRIPTDSPFASTPNSVKDRAMVIYLRQLETYKRLIDSTDGKASIPIKKEGKYYPSFKISLGDTEVDFGAGGQLGSALQKGPGGAYTVNSSMLRAQIFKTMSNVEQRLRRVAPEYFVGDLSETFSSQNILNPSTTP